TEQVTVPDLSSRFLNEGMQELSRLGLDVGSIQRDYNDSVSDDYIISHEPAANARVAKGTAVKLLVSKGPRPLKVPYLIEKTANEARSSLSAMGLIMQQEEENDDEVEAGRIIRQDPAQGVSIEKGSTVIVWISSGPLLSTVPAVIGLSEKEAQTALEDKGFRVEIKDGISGKELYGKVVDQRPEEGASVRKGVTTTIWIGKKASAGD
ncbi:MAG TPA: PASTA domain-containing protein, partial [Actinobacteria bacterium]|nr:PASTA domain-containing protein [Actinomycetota bacterium]